MWNPLSYLLEIVCALVTLGFFCRLIYLTILSFRGGSAWIRLKSTFGPLEFVRSFAPFLLVGLIIFLVVSGIGAPYSSLLRFLNPAIDDWLFASCLKAGFGADMADHWQQTRVFLAVIVAFSSMVPIAVTSGFGPKLSDNLIVSRTQLIFPQRFLLTLGFRQKRSWSELSQLKVDDSALIFVFDSGHRVRILLSDIETDSVSRLFEIAAHVRPDCLVPDMGIPGYSAAPEEVLDAHSFTELWESDYRRSYKSTTFVPLSVGQTLHDGKYRVVDQLASTSLSATYLALSDLGRPVVLKECAVRDDTSLQSKARELLLRECELLSSLRHERITSVVDTFSIEGRVYLVLDYIEGQTLASWLKENGKREERKALTWALEIAEMLDYLHGREPPIVHRDITPSNLIVDSGENLNLIDFGAANHFESNATGTLIGKQSFIAPEQLRGKATPQSDIYSFGATLYTILTGKEPEALSVCRPCTIDADIAEDIDELVAECTQLESESRIKSACELKSRIETMIEKRKSGEKISLSSKEKVPERR